MFINIRLKNRLLYSQKYFSTDIQNYFQNLYNSKDKMKVEQGKLNAIPEASIISFN